MVSIAESSTRALPSLSPTFRRAAVIAAIAAPVLFVAGQALLPLLGDSAEAAFAGMIEHRDQLVLSRLLTVAGAFLFLFAAGPILSLVPSRTRGGRLLAVGVTLFSIGTFFNGLSNTVQGYAARATTAPGVDADAAMQALLHLDEGLVGFPISYWSIPVFGLGLLLVAVALLISRRVPVWIPIALILAGILGFATAGAGVVVALTQAPLVLAVVALAVLAWRRGYARPLAIAEVSGHAVS